MARTLREFLSNILGLGDKSPLSTAETPHPSPAASAASSSAPPATPARNLKELRESLGFNISDRLFSEVNKDTTFSSIDEKSAALEQIMQLRESENLEALKIFALRRGIQMDLSEKSCSGLLDGAVECVSGLATRYFKETPEADVALAAHYMNAMRSASRTVPQDSYHGEKLGDIRKGMGLNLSDRLFEAISSDEGLGSEQREELMGSVAIKMRRAEDAAALKCVASKHNFLMSPVESNLLGLDEALGTLSQELEKYLGMDKGQRDSYLTAAYEKTFGSSHPAVVNARDL